MAAKVKFSLQTECSQQCSLPCLLKGKVIVQPRSVSLREIDLLPNSNSLNKLSKGTAGLNPFNEF
jgi:hypothetical protein